MSLKMQTSLRKMMNQIMREMLLAIVQETILLPKIKAVHTERTDAKLK